jgi:hypothetical protein
MDAAAARRRYTVDVTFRVIVERDPESGDYSAVCPELSECASGGDRSQPDARRHRDACRREALRGYG